MSSAPASDLGPHLADLIEFLDTAGALSIEAPAPVQAPAPTTHSEVAAAVTAKALAG